MTKVKYIEVLVLLKANWLDHGVAQVDTFVFSGVDNISRQCHSCGVAVLLGNQTITHV